MMAEFRLTVIQMRKSDSGFDLFVHDQEHGRLKVAENSGLRVEGVHAQQLIDCLVQVPLAGIPGVHHDLQICRHVVVHLLLDVLFLSYCFFGLIITQPQSDL